MVNSTSDDGIITADGVITRAAGVDKTAMLTATVTRGEASVTKTFDVTVTGYVPLTLEAFTFEDAEGNTRFSAVDGGKLKSGLKWQLTKLKTATRICLILKRIFKIKSNLLKTHNMLLKY